MALLVLALFGGRIWREIMERRRDKKGKRKEIGQAEMLSLVRTLYTSTVWSGVNGRSSDCGRQPRAKYNYRSRLERPWPSHVRP